jgi:ribosome maturation factor RimP
MANASHDQNLDVSSPGKNGKLQVSSHFDVKWWKAPSFESC